MLLKTLGVQMLGNALIGIAVVRPGRWYSNIYHIDKDFQFCFIFWAKTRLLKISTTNLGAMEFIQDATYPE